MSYMENRLKQQPPPMATKRKRSRMIPLLRSFFPGIDLKSNFICFPPLTEPIMWFCSEADPSFRGGKLHHQSAFQNKSTVTREEEEGPTTTDGPRNGKDCLLAVSQQRGTRAIRTTGCVDPSPHFAQSTFGSAFLETPPHRSSVC